MYNAQHTFAEFGISHINKNHEIKEAWVGYGCLRRFDMCFFFHCILARFFIIALSFWISSLLFQIIGICVLQWMGAARGWMPDTYVPYRVLTFISTCHCASQMNNVAYSCSPKLSAKATSPARKMRCVSGRMNVAVVMDTLELAVTLVRDCFCFFFTFTVYDFHPLSSLQI